MKYCILGILVLLIGVSLSRAEQPASRPVSRPASRPIDAWAAGKMPAEAKTTEDIVKAAQPIKLLGQIESVEFNNVGIPGRRVFTLWFCPFSGRGDSFLYSYYYDYDKAQWVRFVERMVSSKDELTAEIDEILFPTAGGDAAVSWSAAAYPRKN